MTIHLLAPDVAAKIAAGEVVERPANVAKELLENSLDADATDIRVEMREGGLRLLRVGDNGHGMPADEATLAFQRHATSKLTTVDDLDRIASFGFRGEALYSIAAVSQLTLLTRHAGESSGAEVHLDAGELVTQGKAGAPVGTVVTVEHLFFNVPARKKFLRKPATEAGQITAIVQRYALAFPDRRFTLINDGRLVFQSTGAGDLMDVLVKVYGLENARQMTPIGGLGVQSNAETPRVDKVTGSLDDEVDFMGAVADRPSALHSTPEALRVSGYTSLPTLTRANRSNIELFVNRRYVEDRTLSHAVVQAYHTLLQVGRYPMAVVLIDIDPSQVDVNVHPQKSQVRFSDERRVFGEVQKAMRRALLQHMPVPDVSLSGDGTTLHTTASPARSATGWTGPWADPAGAEQRPLELFVPAGEARPTMTPAERMNSAQSAAARDDSSPPVSPHQEADIALTMRSRQLPPLRVVGQIGAMYIVAEGPEGVYLIDQHAAHERILYEKFMAQRYGAEDGGIARQHLLEPLTLHMGGASAGMVAQHVDELCSVGFEIEPFGGDSFLVRAVPGVLAGEDPLRSLEEIVQSLANYRNSVSEALEDRLIKMVCKRAAIKAGQLLSLIEMQELVRQLEECQSPRTCPHGRPTMIQLSAGELEKAFGRV